MEKTGWWLTHPSEKYEFVSWDSFSQHMEKKTCSKPPPGGKEELLIINEMNPVNYNHVRIMSNSYHTKQIQTKNAPQETAQSH